MRSFGTTPPSGLAWCLMIRFGTWGGAKRLPLSKWLHLDDLLVADVAIWRCRRICGDAGLSYRRGTMFGAMHCWRYGDSRIGVAPRN